MAPPANRYASTKAVLGGDLFIKVQDSRVLVVGAGGIGCELIKNMVMTGFGGGEKGCIEVLDLDTIDLSNLNRQFLFQKQHVKRPKAVVARETALRFNPNVNIKALHRNIKDAEFSVDYFTSFDFVLNALDNLDARRHVNKMCLAASVPLIESGTSGYVGQVQPIKKDVTECFDCTGKPVPKTFAVCTIRSTPSTAHHCIAWAKSYLFPQLFGTDEDAEQEEEELRRAEREGENADEIKTLRKEAEAVKELRKSLKEEGAAKRVFDKVYTADIQRLLAMSDMWRHRKPPHALNYDELELNVLQAPPPAADEKKEGIKDQRSLSIEDSFELFLSSISRLSARINPSVPLAFDKDDDDTLDFVVAAANLRAAAFDIESQTRFQVKEYAGNIIPAIATTNAIIAGVLVHQSLHLLRTSTWPLAKMVWLSRQPQKIFSLSNLPGPNPHCSVCRVVYLPVKFKEEYTLGEFVKDVVQKEVGFEEFVSVSKEAQVLYETEDLEDNADRSMKSLGFTEGTFLTVVDDEDHYPIQFSIGASLPADAATSFVLGARVPSPIPTKVPPPAPPAPDSDDEELPGPGPGAVEHHEGDVVGKKRSADEADLGEEGSAKKAKKLDYIVLDDDETGVQSIDLT